MPTAKESVQARIQKVRDLYETANEIQIRIHPEEVVELTQAKCPAAYESLRKECQACEPGSHRLMLVGDAEKFLAACTSNSKATDAKS